MGKMRAWVLISIVAVLAAPRLEATVPVTLKGSPASMQRQNRVAKQAGFLFVESTDALQKLVDEGQLVAIPGNADYEVKATVSHKVAQPEMRLFIERLAEQYRAATGEQLVVTSLTRTQSRQPGNAHELSVHPTGMAVDLRVSSRRASRAWLEAVLLKLERQGLLDVTRERWPPHYHVALFPETYRSYVEGMIGREAVAAALAGDEVAEQPEEPVKEQEVATVQAPADQAAASAASEPWSFVLFGAAVLLSVVVARRRRGPNHGGAGCIRNECGTSDRAGG